MTAPIGSGGGDNDDRTVFDRPSRSPRPDGTPDAGAPDATEIVPLAEGVAGPQTTEIVPLEEGADPMGYREPAASPPAQSSTRIISTGKPPSRDAPDTEVGTATQRRTLDVGTVIQGTYRIDGVLKSGGMGAVYRGQEIHTDAPVAIKVILPEFKDDEKAGLLFKREASTLRQLADDAIVRYFAYVFDVQLDRYCIVMEFIVGKQLSEVIGDGRPIELDDARALLARIARGLAKAHRIGVVHRDLAPDNVMLRDGDVREAVLIDFGIARSNAVHEATMRDQFAGRLRYTSPEQLGRFNMNIGPHTDVYSLALVIAAALRGTPLDMGFTSMADAVDARRDVPELPAVPAEMAPLLRHMLEPNPANRPGSMDRVLELLADPAQIPRRYWQDGSVPPAPLPVRAASGTQSGWPPSEAGAASAGLQQPPMTGSGPLPVIDPPLPRPENSEGGRWVWLAIVALVAMLGGSLWFLERSGGLDPVFEWVTGSQDPQPETAVETGPGRDRAKDTRAAFLAEWPRAGCIFVKRVEFGSNAGGLDGFAAQLGALDGVAEDYAAEFGAAQLRRTEVAPAQCPTLELARALQGYGEPALDIVLDAESVTGTGEMVGRVIDASNRETWLAVVLPDGKYIEVTARLGPPRGGERAFTLPFNPIPMPTEGIPVVLVAVATDAPSTTLDTAPDRGPSEQLFPRIAERIFEFLDGQGAVGLAAYRWLP